MDSDPPEDAYSRLSEPARYRSVVEHARDKIDWLRSSFDCVVDENIAPEIAERMRMTDGEHGLTIHPATSNAAPIAVALRDRTVDPVDPDPYQRYITHGVTLLCGRWHSEGFPRCGCDACDEDPDDLIEEFDSIIDEVTRGTFDESWDGTHLEYRFSYGAGRAWNASRDWRRRLGPPGTVSWQP